MMNMVDPAAYPNACEHERKPLVDPALRSASDRFFVSVRAETYRCVRDRETDMLALPWGPRLDVTFDPKGAPGIVGGRVRVMARTAGTEIEVANIAILNPNQPIGLTLAMGCDEYVIKAQLGSNPGPASPTVESSFYARVYDAR